jgi:hypothetical protein
MNEGIGVAAKDQSIVAEITAQRLGRVRQKSKGQVRLKNEMGLAAAKFPDLHQAEMESA